MIKKDLAIIFLFTVIWFCRPLSYDDIKMQHLQQHEVFDTVLTKTYIGSQELDFLEKYQKDLILVKDDKSNFFTEAFPTSPTPKRPSSTG